MGGPVAGATLPAGEAVVVVVVLTITAEEDNINTIGKVTTTMISDPADHPALDASMEASALEATMEGAVAMVEAFALFVVLHGIMPSNALRQSNDCTSAPP